MRRTLMLALLLATLWCQAQTVSDSAWRSDVKSVQLYRSGAELDFPMLAMGQPATLVLEFDVLRPQPETLHWRIAHCDRHWRPDELEPSEFMSGFAEGELDQYDFSFNTRVDYVHYRALLPGDFAEFTHSGNYLLEVTDSDEGTTLLTRRFCVSEQAVRVQTDVALPYDGIDRDSRQEVDVLLSSNTLSLNEQWLAVSVQQNGRLDNRSQLTFSGYDGNALAYRFRQPNIFAAGNTYRFFDCSNLGASMYNVVRVEDYGGQLFAMLRPDENRSRKVYLDERTLFGGWKANVWDRQNPRLEADYVWVNFSLPMEQPLLEGTVHIVGALTDWKLDTLSQMDYQPQSRTYTKRLLLKQGYYSYLLLVDTSRSHSGRTATSYIEGDHRETPNTYTVFVYMRAPNDRADRLVAVQHAKP